jgi:hypothetical protein
LVFSFFIPFVANVDPSFSGEATKKEPEDFGTLRQSRFQLLTIDIPDLEKTLRDLKSEQVKLASDDESQKFGVFRAKRQIELLKKEPSPDQSEIQTLQNFLDNADQEIKTRDQRKKEVDGQIIKVQEQLSQKQRELSNVENKITNFLSLEVNVQRFKREVSLYFAGLVAIVIIGFFYIAHGDEKVRQAIFSGTAGIQFVTLFSLVIAIILFGITTILEGKELAALLGGLSGYILGRVTTERESAAHPTLPAAPQTAPPVAPQPVTPSVPAPAPPPMALQPVTPSVPAVVKEDKHT